MKWLLLAALLALGSTGTASAQGGGWTPEERLLISDFTMIVGVAGDGFRIHAATLNGLLTWDPARRAWNQPLTVEDGYPVGEQPSALAWSPAEQALVLGTRLGRLWRLDAAGGRIEPFGAVPGPVEALQAGQSGDLYVRTPSAWLTIPAGSMVPRASAPPADLRRELDERLRSLSGVLGLDERLRRWPVTAVTAGTRADDYYVGTAGAGMLRVDARTLRTEPLPYGGTGRAVTAIAQLGGMLWFAVRDPSPGRSAVFSADSALGRWIWPDPQREGAPGSRVSALIVLGPVLWAAGADGLYRLAQNSTVWDRFDTRAGLPSAEVTALAASDSALWVGTRRGACLWRGDVCGPTLLPGLEVTALSYCSRSLWIGTAQGLWEATPSGLARAEPPGLAGQVRSLACRDGSLYLAGARQLLIRENGVWLAPVPIGGSGTVHCLTADGDGVWVGGDAGAARWNATAREWLTYLVPNDIPAGPVVGLLPTGSRLWLATPAGALRLEQRPH